jgi:hypothetical protein
MTIEWQANECFVDSLKYGRIMLRVNRWRAERLLGDFTLPIGWHATAIDAKLAVERSLFEMIP